MKLTKDDINRIYDEMERRLDKDIKELYEDGYFNDKNQDEYTKDMRYNRMQGVYGTLMAITTDDEWRDLVWIIYKVDQERGYIRKKHSTERKV